MITLDVETYSDLDLRKVGTARYFEHPSAQCLMLTWLDQDGLHTWDQSQDDTNRERFLSLATQPDTVLSAWNARFEWSCLHYLFGVTIPWRRLHCDMVAALSLGLPGGLAQCGAAIDLDEKYLKQDGGKRLIQKFCKPRKPSKHKPWTRSTHETDPEDWAQFVEYNRQDVVAEHRIRKRLKRWL